METTDRWRVYIVECADRTLYTGVTKDLQRRMKEHNEPHKGAKYTRVRQPVRLVYAEDTEDRKEALKREYAIKQLSRQKKLILIKTSRQTHNL